MASQPSRRVVVAGSADPDRRPSGANLAGTGWLRCALAVSAASDWPDGVDAGPGAGAAGISDTGGQPFTPSRSQTWSCTRHGRGVSAMPASPLSRRAGVFARGRDRPGKCSAPAASADAVCAAGGQSTTGREGPAGASFPPMRPTGRRRLQSLPTSLDWTGATDRPAGKPFIRP